MFNYVLALLLTVFGLFFISLGLLFINYDWSPFRLVVQREDIFTNVSLGLKIMLPGFILFFLTAAVLR